MRVPVRRVAEQAAIVAVVALLILGALSTWRPVKVTGWSMHPALHPGDLVFVRRSRPVAVGDVILFRAPGHGPVLHRVVGVDAAGTLRTRGDANDVVDREPLTPSMVVGPVRAVVPVGRVLTRWRGSDSCATIAVPIEQYEAMTETTYYHKVARPGKGPLRDCKGPTGRRYVRFTSRAAT